MTTEIIACDWNAIGSDERIPRWPSRIGEKRALHVAIASWTSCGAIGAKHWYVEIQEQNNAWWSESENAWVELSCDSSKAGYSLRASVMTQEEAVALAIHFVEVVAGKRRAKHHVVWSGPGRPQWGH